jgi:hypothetical protein
MAYHSLYGRKLGIDENGVLRSQGALAIDEGTKTATAVAGAVTLSKLSGKITTEALSTAAAATYTLTLTNTKLLASDLIFVSVANGTNAVGTPAVATAKCAAGSASIVIQNIHASVALSGTLIISFTVQKA